MKQDKIDPDFERLVRDHKRDVHRSPSIKIQEIKRKIEKIHGATITYGQMQRLFHQVVEERLIHQFKICVKSFDIKYVQECADIAGELAKKED